MNDLYEEFKSSVRHVIDKRSRACLLDESMNRQKFIMMNKKQVYLKSITKITIYSRKIVRLDIVLNVAENHLKNRFIVIFTNCQVVIQIIQCFKKQSDQYLLQTLTQEIEQCDREIHIH